MDAQEVRKGGEKEKGANPFAWLQIFLLSSAWACAFSALTSTVTALTVTSKAVGGSLSLAALPEGILFWSTGLANFVILKQTRQLGVKRSFVLGALIGALGSGCIALAVVRCSYVGICLSAAVLGYGNAHGNLYRFWAARFVPPHQMPTAIAAVLTGGCVGAAIGPEYSKRTAALFPRHRYSGIFAVTAGVFVANAVIIALVSFPQGPPEAPERSQAPERSPEASEAHAAAPAEDSAAGGAGCRAAEKGGAAEAAEKKGERRGVQLLGAGERDAPGGAAGRAREAAPAETVLAALATQTCWTAVVVASLSYGIMAFLMVPVPVSMVAAGYSFTTSSLVVQVHMLAMFVPSFLSGRLIQSLGCHAVMALGALIIIASSGVFLRAERLANYSVGEVLVGVGWNMCFSGATNQLAAYSAGPRVGAGARSRVAQRLEAINDFGTFAMSGCTSFVSAVLLAPLGWTPLQYISQGVCGLIFLLVCADWAAERRRERRQREGAAAGRQYLVATDLGDL